MTTASITVDGNRDDSSGEQDLDSATGATTDELHGGVQLAGDVVAAPASRR
jgi:hypothetical protein